MSGVLLFASACAHEPPTRAIEDYRRALEGGDVHAAWVRTSSSARGRGTEADLGRELASHPEVARAAASKLGSPVVAVRELAEVTLANGEKVLVAREDGTWRLVTHVARPLTEDTPERALASFFRAVERGDLAAVRRSIPARFAGAYAADDALRAHLAAERTRIETARNGIAAAKVPAATIAGERARITYGDGLAAELEREGGLWKIVDLE